MSKCAGFVSCKWLRPSPWKKSLKSLYPPNSSGYERDLEAHNVEDLAKLALRNEKLFTPISNALVKNINRDLRKGKYGYVSIGVSAFIALVDMCHDNLYRFEASVFSVLSTLLQEKDVAIRVDAMNLLIKVCQSKEQNDDSGNTQYFDLLDYILNDCGIQLTTFEETIKVRQICVDVLYQLVMICPAALITTYPPKIIPILVDLIYFCHMKEYKDNPYVQALCSKSIRCLSSIYPLVNITTSSALLTPVFLSLDSYGWYSMNFVRATLKPLISTKNREASSRPAYLQILSYVQTLLPLMVDDDGDPVVKDGIEMYPAGVSEIEMKDFTITSRRLRIVCNILLFVQSIFKDTKVSVYLHISQIMDILFSIYHFTLELAAKNQIPFPLSHQECEVEDALQYEDSQSDQAVFQKCIIQLNSICEDTLVAVGKSISDISLFFGLVNGVLDYLIETEEESFSKQSLHLAIQIMGAKQIPSSILLPGDLLITLSTKLLYPFPDDRLLWIQLLSTFFHMIKVDSSIRVITSLRDLPLQSCLYQSFFIENNTQEHYQALCGILSHLLTLDIQNALLFVLPILLASQSTVVELVGGSSSMSLLQYLDSTTISTSILSQLENKPTMSQMMSSRGFMSELEPVTEGEEDEEVAHDDIGNQYEIEKGNEIPLTDGETTVTEEGEVEVPLMSSQDLGGINEQEASPFDVSRPSGSQYNILSCNLTILLTIATLLKSEELQQYISTIQDYQHEHWSEEKPSHEQPWSGKQAFYQREAIVQFIIRSPVILSSPVPADYADQLRQPLSSAVEIEEEEIVHGHLHRLNSISSSSELSIKNSVKDSDSDVVEFNYLHDNSALAIVQGSRYIMENPQCSFAELMENVKLAREGKDLKLFEKIEHVSSTIDDTMNSKPPGFDNQTVSLMI